MSVTIRVTYKDMAREHTIDVPAASYEDFINEYEKEQHHITTEESLEEFLKEMEKRLALDHEKTKQADDQT